MSRVRGSNAAGHVSETARRRLRCSVRRRRGSFVVRCGGAGSGRSFVARFRRLVLSMARGRFGRTAWSPGLTPRVVAGLMNECGWALEGRYLNFKLPLSEPPAAAIMIRAKAETQTPSPARRPTVATVTVNVTCPAQAASYCRIPSVSVEPRAAAGAGSGRRRTGVLAAVTVTVPKSDSVGLAGPAP